MIRISGPVECAGSAFERDPWVPLTLSWQVPVLSVVLYLRVSGVGGGELELKVDAETGALFELVVIDLPPSEIGMRSSPEIRNESRRALALDRSIWDWKITPDYIEPSSRVVFLREEVRFFEGENSIRISFGENISVFYFSTGGISLGVDGRGCLSDIFVEK